MRYMVIWTTIIIFCMDFSLSMENTGTQKYLSYTTMQPKSATSYFCEDEDDFSTEVHCYGKMLVDIPTYLNKTLRKLTVTDSDMKYIKRTSLNPYRESLRDVTLSNLPYLRVVEEGTFANMPNLRSLYISHAPQLKFVHGLLRGVTSSKFYSLRIIWTGLVEVPDLFALPQNNTMFLLDLDHNKIEHLPANSIKITAQQVTLNFNEITRIDDFAFNGSQIAELYMRSNYRLSQIGNKAFKGLKDLRMLDLSETAIKGLPVEGIEELETLKVENTPSMETIPSIYDLKNLKEAKLTHSFHCCAFKYPEQHNPKKHAQYEENMKKLCREIEKARGRSVVRKKRYKGSTDVVYSQFIPINTWKESDLSNSSLIKPLVTSINEKAVKKMSFTPLRGQTIERQRGKPVEVTEEGVFHGGPMQINENQLDALCGNITFKMPEVECSPKPNALNPCEDIMGSSWLRVSVWCVVILAIVGNLSVIIVVLFSDSEINVSRFLICNLAFADFCMGLYLLLIASMDYHSVGVYFNFAYNWQYGLGCQIAGFLTVFSCHLSIYTLTVVTLERWFAITYAMHLTKRITLTLAKSILVGGWCYSILMATLPVLGISNYSSTSICLPMEANRITDYIYLYCVIIINGLAFALIVFCYVQIYLSLGYETRHASTKGEMTIAKKMSLLVFTDFATWAPIAFFGLTALAGYPLIGVTRSKILLVFFYPLNACANPYLYALMTSQYRSDLLILISRCGICKKKALRYKLSETLPMNANPLIHRTNSCPNGQYNSTANIKSGHAYV